MITEAQPFRIKTMARIHAFRAGTPNLAIIEDTHTFFDTCKSAYPQFRKNNYFDENQEEAFYLYQIDNGKEKQTGLLCTLDLKDYIDGKVIRHEKTLSAKRQHMQHLFKERQAHIKPALLTFPAVDELKDLLIETRSNAKLVYQTTYLKEVHRIWSVQDKKMIKKFEKAYATHIDHTYIADGHHRTEAATELFQADMKAGKQSDHRYLLVALFSSDQLRIDEFNRLIYSFNGMSKKQLLNAIKKSFKIKASDDPVMPQKKHEIGMVIGSDWYRLNARKSILKPGPSGLVLDVNLVNQFILNEVLDIHDVSHDNRVQYIEGPKGIRSIEKKVKKESEAFGLTLYPITFEEFKKVTDAGEVLPPKSTWFEPRMRNGFITQLIG